MVKFGELSKVEQVAFEEQLKKAKQIQNTTDKTELWPDDDEELVPEYFSKPQAEGS